MYCIVRNGKYLAGHSYSPLSGYKFKWTRNSEEARTFEKIEDTTLISLVSRSGGVKVPFKGVSNKLDTYLLIFQDKSVYKSVGISSDDLQACNDGFLSILNCINMTQYIKGNWLPIHDVLKT